MDNQRFSIHPITSDDHTWIVPLLEENWGSTLIVSRGRLFDAQDNPGYVAKIHDKPAGFITFEIQNKECEITTLNSLSERKGIGTALIDAVKTEAEKEGCSRLWLITTNDNTHAFRFYQKYGFTLANIYPDVIKKSRERKPGIPLYGNDGIPIRDEIELELFL